MSRVLSIRYCDNAAPQAAAFLRAWEQRGLQAQQVAGSGYALHSRPGEELLLACSGAELQITGPAQDDTYSFIKAFAASSGGELLH